MTLTQIWQQLENIKKRLLEMLALLAQKEKPPETSGPLISDLLHALHHSGTSRDNTKAETIINQQKKEYGGKTFYDALIDKTGRIYRPEAVKKTRGTYDICVLGDFTREKPTTEQIESLKTIITGKDWTTHKDLAKEGKAISSVCPGNLTDYL